MRARTIAAAVLAAAAVGGAAATADATPKSAAKSEQRTLLVNEFRVEYEATVSWSRHQALPDMTEDDALSYTLRGTLPNIKFVAGGFSTAVSRTVDTTVAGTASVEVVKPQGTSVSCGGTSVTVHALTGIGRAPKGFWFGSWLSGTGLGSCTDSDGGTPPLTLQVGLPTPKDGIGEEMPAGVQEYVVPKHRMDVDRWSQPFRIAAEDDTCPNYDPSLTIGCSYVMKGQLTLTRVSRKEEADDTGMDDLLAPSEPPKLNRKKTKATTEVTCKEACDIEALIGVFGGTRKHPKVTPIRRKKLRLKAERATTISLPVTAKARAVAKQGRLVMTLRATGGKRQIYPLV